MPVFHTTYHPTSSPPLNPRRNLLNIAHVNNVRRDLANLTVDQKVAVIDLIIALGLRVGSRPPDHLRDAVDLAHVRNKAKRLIHEGYSAVLFEGICVLMEHAEEALVFANVYRDTRSDYFVSNQGTAIVANNFYHRLPARLAKIPSPLFTDAMREGATSLARLLPGFLNEKVRRVNWGREVADRAADIPFIVHVPFPPEILRRPGIPPPGFDPMLGDAPDHGPGGGGPGGNAPPPGGNNGAGGGEDDDDDSLSDCSITSEEWRVFEAMEQEEERRAEEEARRAEEEARRAQEEARRAQSSRSPRLPRYTSRPPSNPIDDEDDDDDAHANDLRAAMVASRQAYARELQGVRGLSLEPSGSQGIPAAHVDPSTGATVRGTFVPNLVTPTTPSSSRVGGTWVYVTDQSPFARQTPPSVVFTPRHRRKENAQAGTPTGSSAKGKGKGKEPAR